MAYNNGFPINYPFYQQPMQYQPPAQNSIMRVRDENEARMYCVAPGNSMTFVDEDAKYLFTKTVNMGQFDRPIFEKYRLVKEDAMPAETAQEDAPRYALADDLDALKAELESVKGDLYGVVGKKRKKEVSEDE